MLRTSPLGEVLIELSEIDSTNNYAMRLINEGMAEHGMTIRSDFQTTGKGQHGNSWQAEERKNLLFTTILDTKGFQLQDQFLLNAFACLSVADYLMTNADIRNVTIKWPNDIYAGDRKIAGILVEKGRGTVVGIGLNISQTEEDFLEAGLELGGSLGMFSSGAVPSHSEVQDSLLEALDLGLPAIQRGETRELEAAWREGLGLVGVAVRVEAVGRVALGMVEEVGLAGVVLAQDDGARRRFLPEEILRIHPLGDFLRGENWE